MFLIQARHMQEVLMDLLRETHPVRMALQIIGELNEIEVFIHNIIYYGCMAFDFLKASLTGPNRYLEHRPVRL